MEHSTIWMAGLYLMLLMHFLENKVAAELTRSEFVEAQEVHFVRHLIHYFIPIFLLVCKILLDFAGFVADEEVVHPFPNNPSRM